MDLLLVNDNDDVISTASKTTAVSKTIKPSKLARFFKKRDKRRIESFEYVVFSGGAQKGNVFLGSLGVLLDILSLKNIYESLIDLKYNESMQDVLDQVINNTKDNDDTATTAAAATTAESGKSSKQQKPTSSKLESSKNEASAAASDVATTELPSDNAAQTFMKQLVQNNMVDTFHFLKGCGGTSIGALFALGVLLCIPFKRFKSWCFEQDTSDFVSQMAIGNILTSKGVLPFSYLTKYITNLLYIAPDELKHKYALLLQKKKQNQQQQHTTNDIADIRNITFAELYEITERKKELYVIASNLTKRSAKLISHRTTPNWKVCHGVAASMCIPWLFEPFSDPDNGDLMVDGGVYDNYAIKTIPFPIEKTLGFRIRSSVGGDSYIHGRLDASSSAQEYFCNLIFDTMDQYESRIMKELKPIYRSHTVPLFVPHPSGPMDLISASKTLKNKYIFIGEITMLIYFFPLVILIGMFVLFSLRSHNNNHKLQHHIGDISGSISSISNININNSVVSTDDNHKFGMTSTEKA